MLCFLLPDAVRRLPQAILGRDPWRRQRTAILVLALVFPTLAVVGLVVEVLGGPNLWNFTSKYALYYGIVIMGLIGVPQDSWKRLEAISPYIEADVRDLHDRTKLIDIVHRAIRLDVQVLVGLIGCVAGIVGAAVAAHARDVPVYEALPFELAVGLTVLLQSNVVMWTLCGCWWLGVWTRLPSLRFDSYDPLRSLGLKKVYELTNRGQWYLTGGLVLLIIPLVLLYNEARDNEFLRVIVIISAVTSVIVVVLAYIVPPWCLRAARVRDKEALLTELHVLHGVELSDVDSEQLRNMEPTLALYSSVQARATGRVNGNRVASLAGALISLAAAFLPLLLGGQPMS